MPRDIDHLRVVFPFGDPPFRGSALSTGYRAPSPRRPRWRSGKYDVLANGALYREFIMVSTKTSDPFVDDFYLGLPSKTFLALFDGFEEITESDLPKVINTLHIADASTDEFKSRFHFADRRHHF